MLPHALKVRPAAAGALFAVAAFSICAVADRAEGLLIASAKPHAAAISPGDTVRYWGDRMTYEVMNAGETTLLLQRGEVEAYVHRDEVVAVR